MQRINALLHTRQTTVVISTSHTLEAQIQKLEELRPAPIALVLVKIVLRGRVALDDARPIHWMSVGERGDAQRGEAGGAGEGVAGWTPDLPEVVGNNCDEG